MDNAGVTFEEAEKFQLPDETPQQAPEQPKKSEVAPLTYTSPSKDKVDAAKKAFIATLGDVPGAKYETDSFKDDTNTTQYRLTVTGISASQRKKLFDKKTTLKESLDFDFDRYQMLRRAGIIK